MTHQQRVSHSGPAVTERPVGESRQCPSLAFVLKKDNLSIRSNNKQ